MRIASFSLAASLAALTYAPIAAAEDTTPSLDTCKSIYVEANAECTVIPPRASCEANCTPLTVRAACAADLKDACNAECSGGLSASCSAACEADCATTCKADPGKFECQAYCQTDCAGSCEAACKGNKDGARCKASCEATCSANCNSDCKVQSPTASCEAHCKASCDGSCHAQAELDCQLDCQAQGFVNCEADFEGECKLACRKQDGVLFCDSSWIDTGSQLSKCVDNLKAALNVDFKGTAEGKCENGTCKFGAEGSANAGCSAYAGNDAASASSFMLVLAALGLCVGRRRRR